MILSSNGSQLVSILTLDKRAGAPPPQDDDAPEQPRYFSGSGKVTFAYVSVSPHILIPKQ
jgi:hypothetical protein